MVRGKTGTRGPRGYKGTPGKDNNYIDAKTFSAFCNNQDKLIDIFNHRISKLEENTAMIKVDVSWTKKILWAILGVIIVNCVTIIVKGVGA